MSTARRAAPAPDLRALVPLTAVAAPLAVGAATAVGPAAAAAVIAAIGTALVVIARPRLGTYALLAVVPAVSGLRRGFPVPGFRLSELAILCVATLVIAVHGGRRSAGWRTFDLAALLYAGVALAAGGIATLERGSAFTLGGLGDIGGPIQFVLLYRATLVGLDTVEARLTGVRVLLLASVPVSLVTVLQFANVGPVRAILQDLVASGDRSTIGYYTTLGVARASGPFSQPHQTAAYLLVVIVVAGALLLAPTRRVLPTASLLGIALVAGAALATTATATPALAAAAAIVILGFWLRRTGRVLLALGTGAALAALAFSSTIEGRVAQQVGGATHGGSGWLPASLRYRIDIWTEQYLPAMRGHWLVGWGPGVPPGVTWQSTESLYLTLAVRGGVFLIAAYVVLVAAWLAASLAVRRQPVAELAMLARANVVLVVLLAAMHLVSIYFVLSGLPHLLWPLAAIATAASYAPGPEPDG